MIHLTVYSRPAEMNTDEQAEREAEIVRAVERVSPHRRYLNGECLMTWSYSARNAARMGIAAKNLIRLDHVDRVEIR